ncbi:MAG TPA: hypothetical protein VKW08_14805 [Xanthobacteraceae bacterium]|nr:hypothetical protein [Xanthobacteraceae bacterium]
MTPTSGQPGKLLTRALLQALSESSPEANASNLRRIIDRLVAKAIEGDLSAIREIFDRIDGKASAGGTGSDEPKKVVFRWKGDEE